MFDNRRRRDDRRNDHDGRDERRRRDDLSDHEEYKCPQKKSIFSRYESNVSNQSKYILISSLTSSSPPSSWGSWLVDSGATHHVKGFGSVKFHLDYGESILFHDVVYVLGLKKNLVSIATLEDKGMRFSFIRGNVIT